MNGYISHPYLMVAPHLSLMVEAKIVGVLLSIDATNHLRGFCCSHKTLSGRPERGAPPERPVYM
jgi:hypothetical protein